MQTPQPYPLHKTKEPCQLAGPFPFELAIVLVAQRVATNICTTYGTFAFSAVFLFYHIHQRSQAPLDFKLCKRFPNFIIRRCCNQFNYFFQQFFSIHFPFLSSLRFCCACYHSKTFVSIYQSSAYTKSRLFFLWLDFVNVRTMVHRLCIRRSVRHETVFDIAPYCRVSNSLSSRQKHSFRRSPCFLCRKHTACLQIGGMSQVIRM